MSGCKTHAWIVRVAQTTGSVATSNSKEETMMYSYSLSTYFARNIFISF